jgi:hypothetical protein
MGEPQQVKARHPDSGAFQHLQALEDAVAYRTGLLAVPCPDCVPGCPGARVDHVVEHVTARHPTGVPISIVSKWAGHHDAAFTQRTYVHASTDDLEQGRKALARIHKIA